MPGMEKELIQLMFGLVTLGGVIVAAAMKVFDRVIPSRSEKTIYRMEKCIGEIEDQVNDLHHAHLSNGAKTPDGSPKWWFPQELMTSIKNIEGLLEKGVAEIKQSANLASAHEKQADAMASVAESMKRMGGK